MDSSVLEVLQQRLDSSGCIGENALPAAQGADGPSANSAGVKPIGGHLAEVRLEQLGEGHLRSEGAAHALQADQYAKQQCEVAGEGQPVAVQNLHACVGRADHVEIGDATAQVPIEPGADLAVQPVDVDVGGGVGEIDDDVGQLVDVPGTDGEQQVLNLGLTCSGKAADVAEVEDCQMLPIGKQEVPRMRVGVVDAVPDTISR